QPVPHEDRLRRSKTQFLRPRVANLGAQESANAIIFRYEKKLYAAATTPERFASHQQFPRQLSKSPT
ncbi:MAG: hypothetical protein WAM77_24000, partial [Xanthobacteraceae bacterium]